MESTKMSSLFVVGYNVHKPYGLY